ncbi:MAG: hypothetical protein ACREQM_04400 [Candidatus Dormibacteraceae bacterium]
MAEAMAQPPPTNDAETHGQVQALTARVHPLSKGLLEAINSTPADPTKPGAAQKDSASAQAQAQAVVDQLVGGQKFNTGRFVIAMAIFAVLIGGGVATEAIHLTSSSGTLLGLGGAFFGVVAAFLGTEKGKG